MKWDQARKSATQPADKNNGSQSKVFD